MAESLEDFTTAQLQESTRLLRTLLNSPDTRETTLRLIKKKTGTSIPEIDARDAVMGEVEKERAARIALEARLQEKEIMDRIEKERAKITRDNGFTAEDVKAVEALMIDKEAPIPSYAAAAKVYKASQTIAQPTTHQLTPRTWDMPEKDVWAAGIGNKMALNKIALTEAYKAAEEFRKFGGAAPLGGLGAATSK